ncbi:transposable element Tcb1 transposase [Trichonephila clavipes]|nr:transposable element Tcb1 transposase [Trichonephila clavipes]
MDHAAPSRIIPQQIQSVTYHSVSARKIRRGLQQSGMPTRHLLFRLPLTGNHRHLRRQWCDEPRTRTIERNDIVFTDESHFYLQHHCDRIRVWRHRVKGCRMVALCITILVLHPVSWLRMVLDFPAVPL